MYSGKSFRFSIKINPKGAHLEFVQFPNDEPTCGNEALVTS